MGIYLESIYATLSEDELLGSGTLTSPPRLWTDISSSQNSFRYRNVPSNLDGDNHEILNILKEMLEDSKESESVILEFEKRSEVMKDSTPGLLTFENRFLFADRFQLKLLSVNRDRDKSFREGFRF